MQKRPCACRQRLVSDERAMTRRMVKPEEQLNCRRSLSMFCRLAGPVQAARPLAGGSLTHVRNQAEQEGSLGRFAQAAMRCLQQEQPREQAQVRLGRSELLSACSRVSIKFMAWFLQLLSSVWHARKVLPNPSIERTSTGLAHSAPQVYVPLRGPSRWRPAHVKR
jgi:hypothetical protein